MTDTDTPQSGASNFRVALIFAGIIALIVWGAVSIFAGDDDPLITADDIREASNRTASTPAASCRDIEYEIAGTGAVFLTYFNAQGNIEQRERVMPVVLSAGCLHPGSFVSVSAQRRDSGSGRVACEITANGVAISEGSSFGEFVIASCDTTVP